MGANVHRALERRHSGPRSKRHTIFLLGLCLSFLHNLWRRNGFRFNFRLSLSLARDCGYNLFNLLNFLGDDLLDLCDSFGSGSFRCGLVVVLVFVVIDNLSLSSRRPSHC